MGRIGSGQAGRGGGRRPPVVVVGGGMGGLAAALGLRARGAEVLLVEAQAELGGKATSLRLGEHSCDAGPTVLTMAWIFRRALAEAGLALEDYVQLRPLRPVVARHLFADGSRLDFFADLQRTQEAIAAFAGRGEAAAYRRFCEHARRLWQRVEQTFVTGPKPTAANMWASHSLATLAKVAAIDAHLSMRQRLLRTFADPRLVQLLGRMSTYAGGAPGMTPATFNLIAHVETLGVWRARGGTAGLMRGLGAALADLGVQLRLGARVERILPPGTAAAAHGQVILASGEAIAASAVVANAPPAALEQWLSTGGPPPAPRRPQAEPVRLSADTACFVARAPAGALCHHNILFAADPMAEFEDIFVRRRRPKEPTIYLCAQGSDPGQGEVAQPMLCLANAPSTSRQEPPCLTRTLDRLAQLGLPLTLSSTPQQRGPADFRRLLPHDQGALYGEPPHSWQLFFRRPGSRSRWPKIYLCGGHVHPGPGLPMTALGGLQAAEAWAADHPSTCRLPLAATRGGTSTPTATTAAASWS